MNSRVFLPLTLIVVWTACVLPAWAATQFTTFLDGSQENPPVVVPGTGAGALTLVDLGSGQFRWDYSVTISDDLDFSNVAPDITTSNGGTAVTNFHIHNQARGVNGGVVYGIYVPDQDNDNDVTAVLNADNTTTISGGWSALDGNPVGNINTFGPGLLAAGLGDVNFYFNVHTAGNPGGEIRGQIVAIPEPSTGVLLILGFVAFLAPPFLRR
jgi:hypothetical protein